MQLSSEWRDTEVVEPRECYPYIRYPDPDARVESVGIATIMWMEMTKS